MQMGVNFSNPWARFASLTVALALGVACDRTAPAPVPDAPRAAFDGPTLCTFDAAASQGSASEPDIRLSAEPGLCVDRITLYAPLAESGQYQRVVLVGASQALDVLTIDTSAAEYRRVRYALSAEALAAAQGELAAAPVVQGCHGETSAATLAARNAILLRHADSEPAQRLVWRCAARQ
ncbi:MAG: hypothetical protein AB7V17_07210 [Hyphomonadaceae bacterium]